MKKVSFILMLITATLVVKQSDAQVRPSVVKGTLVRPSVSVKSFGVVNHHVNSPSPRRLASGSLMDIPLVLPNPDGTITYTVPNSDGSTTTTTSNPDGSNAHSVITTKKIWSDKNSPLPDPQFNIISPTVTQKIIFVWSGAGG